MDIFLHIKPKAKTPSYRKRNKNTNHRLDDQVHSKETIILNNESYFQTVNFSKTQNNQINLYSITNKYTSNRVNKYLNIKNKNKITSSNNNFHNNMIIFNKIKPNDLNDHSINVSIDSNEETEVINNLKKGIEEVSDGKFVINVSKLLNTLPSTECGKKKVNNVYKIFNSENTKKTDSTSITNVSSSDYYNSSFVSNQQVNNNISTLSNNKVKIIGIPYFKYASSKKNEFNNSCNSNQSNINYTISLPKQSIKEVSPIHKEPKYLHSEMKIYNNNNNIYQIFQSHKKPIVKTNFSFVSKNNSSQNNVNSSINEEKTKIKIPKQNKRVFYLNKILKINQK